MKNQRRIEFQEDNSVLQLNYIKPEDEGEYVCKAINKVNEIQKKFSLIVTGITNKKYFVNMIIVRFYITDKKIDSKYVYIPAVIIISIILIIITTILYIKIKRERLNVIKIGYSRIRWSNLPPNGLNRC